MIDVSRMIEASEPRRPRKPSSPKPPEDNDGENSGKKQVVGKQKKGAAKSAKAARKSASEKAAKTRSANARQRRADAAAANKAKRDARKAELKKRAEKRTKDKDSKSPAEQVPSQVAHCMLALKNKRGKDAKAAWNICRWSLTKHGYLKGPYRVNTKLPKAVRQTAKGARRTMQHSNEKGPLGGGIRGKPEEKFKKFKRMFRDIEGEVVKSRRR